MAESMWKNQHISDNFGKQWLLRNGYEEREIKQQMSRSPDFLCSDGKRYEAKLLLGNNALYFSQIQIRILKDEDTILVFDRCGTCVSQFLWKNRHDVVYSIIDYRGRTLKEIEKFTIVECSSCLGKHSSNLIECPDCGFKYKEKLLESQTGGGMN